MSSFYRPDSAVNERCMYKPTCNITCNYIYIKGFEGVLFRGSIIRMGSKKTSHQGLI